MIFHYAGKYNGDESSLPYKEHHPNAIPFKEPKDMKKYSLIANLGCVLIMIVLAIPFLILGIKYIHNNAIQMMAGGICGGLSMFPHELLHAICYNPSLPLANKKWSLFGSIFFNKYAVFPVDMWLLDF